MACWRLIEKGDTAPRCLHPNSRASRRTTPSLSRGSLMAISRASNTIKFASSFPSHFVSLSLSASLSLSRSTKRADLIQIRIVRDIRSPKLTGSCTERPLNATPARRWRSTRVARSCLCRCESAAKELPSGRRKESSRRPMRHRLARQTLFSFFERPKVFVLSQISVSAR